MRWKERLKIAFKGMDQAPKDADETQMPTEKRVIFENATTLTSTAPTSISRHPNTFPNPSSFAGPGFAEIPSSWTPSVVPWLGVGLSPLSLRARSRATNVLHVLKIKARIQT